MATFGRAPLQAGGGVRVPRFVRKSGSPPRPLKGNKRHDRHSNHTVLFARRGCKLQYKSKWAGLRGRRRCKLTSRKTLVGKMVSLTNPAQGGVWSATVKLPVIPIAAAVLPNGDILAWSANNTNDFDVAGTNTSNTLATLFNPLTGQVSPLLDTGLASDMFCPGIAYLPDGRILVNGGSSSSHTAIYDPFHGTFGTWSDAANMNVARAYNGSVTLSNGDVFTIGGSWAGAGGGATPGELWAPGAGWKMTGIAPLIGPDLLDQAENYVSFGDNHPWLFAMPNGQVFDAGPTANMSWFDPLTGKSTPAGNRGDDAYSINGTAVMYAPGKILKAGGAPIYSGGYDPLPGTYDATNSAYVIDVTAHYTDPNAAPVVTKIAPLNHARAYTNGVALPDGEVFVVGGQSHPKVFSDSDSVMVPEMFHPATMTFTDLAPMPVPRDYHSTALLLPDGSVYVGGGGGCSGCASQFSAAGLQIDPNFEDPTADHLDYTPTLENPKNPLRIILPRF